jgi:hypothetical protein
MRSGVKSRQRSKRLILPEQDMTRRRLLDALMFVAALVVAALVAIPAFAA